MKVAARGSDLALYKRLLQQARPRWSQILLVFGLSLLAAPLSLLTPLPLQIAVDSAIGGRPLPGWIAAVLPAAAAQTPTGLLAAAVVLVIAIALLIHVHGMVLWWFQTATGERLVLEFQALLFHHVQRLSLAFHDTQGTADSTYRIQYDAPSVSQILLSGLIPLVGSAARLGGMFVIIALIDWPLALVALSISPVLWVATGSFGRRLRRRWSEIKEDQSAAMSVVQEVLSAVRVVKAFGQEDREHDRFLGHSRKNLNGQLEIALMGGGFDLLIGMMLAAGTAATLLIGVGHVRSGFLTVGELLVVLAYLGQLHRPLETLSKTLTQVQSALSGAERAFALLDEAPEVLEHRHARPLARATGALSFQNVSFAYAEGRMVLHDISFEIAPGTRLGIAGRTGAGKTTLLNLLMRFYDVTAGRILLDEMDVREYRLADLRSQFAIVLQDPVLFSTSIGENIAYARPDATEEEIVAAAGAANVHDFIIRLPEGYRTQVGERGMCLSGGERQRLSLARAFLKNAPILILDEPTSAVDVETEAAIMEAIERLMRGRTTFVIAHRLNTLKDCDRRLEIRNGRLVSPGARLAGNELDECGHPLRAGA